MVGDVIPCCPEYASEYDGHEHSAVVEVCREENDCYGTPDENEEFGSAWPSGRSSDDRESDVISRCTSRIEEYHNG